MSLKRVGASVLCVTLVASAIWPSTTLAADDDPVEKLLTCFGVLVSVTFSSPLNNPEVEIGGPSEGLFADRQKDRYGLFLHAQTFNLLSHAEQQVDAADHASETVTYLMTGSAQNYVACGGSEVPIDELVNTYVNDQSAIWALVANVVSQVPDGQPSDGDDAPPSDPKAPG